MGANLAEASASTPWEAPAQSPLSVVAYRLRMRYNAPRTDRTPRRTLLGKLAPRRQMVSVAAVRGVDLTVREGEFVGIIGRNGSGKSTLLRMLAGVEPPTSGLVMTSYRPQLLGVSAALISDLTGAENIRLGFLALGMTEAQIGEKFDDAARLSALGEAIDLPMRTYSSGMSSRLKFAISVMAEPKILMIDEALSTGDATFSERSKKKMDDLLENAGTVFMVNHAPRTIENVCSRVIWMEKGRIVMDGDTKEVSSRYRSFAYLLAKDREREAMDLLRDTILDTERERARTPVFPEAEPIVPAAPPAGGRKGRVPELEPDPLAQIFTSDMAARRFPGAVTLSGTSSASDTRSSSLPKALPDTTDRPSD